MEQGSCGRKLLLYGVLAAKPDTADYNVKNSACDDDDSENYFSDCGYFEEHQCDHNEVDAFADWAVQEQEVLEQVSLEYLEFRKNEEKCHCRDHENSRENKTESDRRLYNINVSASVVSCLLLNGLYGVKVTQTEEVTNDHEKKDVAVKHPDSHGRDH